MLKHHPARIRPSLVKRQKINPGTNNAQSLLTGVLVMILLVVGGCVTNNESPGELQTLENTKGQRKNHMQTSPANEGMMNNDSRASKALVPPPKDPATGGEGGETTATAKDGENQRVNEQNGLQNKTLSNDPRLAGPKGEDPCLPLKQIEGGIPQFVASAGIVVTTVLEQCLTRLGEPGYLKDSSWLAMNFPCTLGKGDVVAKPSYYGPKNVQFLLTSGCPAKPNSSDKEMVRIIRKQFGLTINARLLAVNPFMVQYWRIPAHNLAGTGSTISIFEHKFLGVPWEDLINHKSQLFVTLYGRENTWGAKDFFQVDGKITVTAFKEFRFDVEKVKVLTEQELEQVKVECTQQLGSAPCGNYL